MPTPGFDVEGPAADPIRNLVYGIGNGNNLVVYDYRTNAWSTVGDTGKNWALAGLAYNPDLNMLYAMSNGNGATLYEINPKTASVQSIGATGIAGTADGGLAFILERRGEVLLLLEGVPAPYVEAIREGLWKARAGPARP